MPLRRCICCRQSLPKYQMLRLVVDGEGEIWPDLQQKAPGRGVYLCMSDACLAAMNDKRLGALKAKFAVRLPQWTELRQKLESALEKQLAQMFRRQAATAAIGRDAVMHRLWNNTPLLLLRAQDAGQALVRQIDDAMAKRQEAGSQAVLNEVISKAWLGGMLGRDSVAVAALDMRGVSAGLVEKLNIFCVWIGRMKVTG